MIKCYQLIWQFYSVKSDSTLMIAIQCTSPTQIIIIIITVLIIIIIVVIIIITVLIIIIIIIIIIINK